MTPSAFRTLPMLCGLIIAGGCSSASVFGAEAVGMLNDTGQVSCYDSSNNVTPCDETSTGDDSPDPGQDGRYGRDAAAAMGGLPKIGEGDAGFDFTRVCMSGKEEGQGDCPSPPPLPTDLENPQPNDWACLRDNVTGLTWTLGDWDVEATWAEASSSADGSYIQRTNSSARCGLSSGWRLPARREGYSLLDVQRQLPAVDPAYFPILANSLFQAVWTSEPTAWHSEFQWAVGFGLAATLDETQCRQLDPTAPPCDEYPPGHTSFTASVLLVNGSWQQPSPPNGQSGTGGRWQIGNDGLTVDDTATSLIWDRCSWGQTGPTCDGTPTIFYDWSDAMQAAQIANTQHYKGFYDWRVPNVRELETLVKIDGNPAIDMNVFPNTLLAAPISLYLTSSQEEHVPGFAPGVWVVDFAKGLVSTTDKVNAMPDTYPNNGPIRLVRGGSAWDPFDGASDHIFGSGFENAPPAAAAL